MRSRRFASEEEARGLRQDEANNALLLRRLSGVPPEQRTAHYVAAVALADASGREEVFAGRCDGVVLEAPAAPAASATIPSSTFRTRG